MNKKNADLKAIMCENYLNSLLDKDLSIPESAKTKAFRLLP